MQAGKEGEAGGSLLVVLGVCTCNRETRSP